MGGSANVRCVSAFDRPSLRPTFVAALLTKPVPLSVRRDAVAVADEVGDTVQSCKDSAGSGVDEMEVAIVASWSVFALECTHAVSALPELQLLLALPTRITWANDRCGGKPSSGCNNEDVTTGGLEDADKIGGGIGVTSSDG